MTQRPTTLRRFSAILLAVAVTFASTSCGDDKDSSLPDRATTNTAASDTSDTSDAFADVDDEAVAEYCTAVQTLNVTSADRLGELAQVAPPEIKAALEDVIAYTEDESDEELRVKAATALQQLVILHRDRCGIPVNFFG